MLLSRAEFAALVREALDAEDLATLHKTPRGQRAVSGEAGRKNDFEKRWATATHDKEFRARLDPCMRRFVREHVAASLDASRRGRAPNHPSLPPVSRPFRQIAPPRPPTHVCSGRFSGICYQAVPSLRVHMPGAAVGTRTLSPDSSATHGAVLI